MASTKTEFQLFLESEVNKVKGIYYPVKAGFLRRLLIKKVSCRKLHPNPNDEFCFPEIGPNYGIISDYEKAFRYFSSLKHNIVAQYKVADMYKNGYYVEKDYKKYKRIIERMYEDVKDMENPFAPVPEIFTRLASIRTKEGETDEAIRLYSEAKDVLAQRIEDNPFFGNLTIMKYLIKNLYELKAPDLKNIDLFDLYELLTKPVKVTFMYDGEEFVVEAVEEDGEVIISFDGKWYRTTDDFFAKASIDGLRLVVIGWGLYDFEVIP